MSFRRWILPVLDKDGASLLAEECEIHPFLALLLHARGVRTAEELRAFLWDDIEDSDPFMLPDMDLAVARVQQAIDSGESVLIFGDYDADGITATVLLYTYLKGHNANVTYHIPTREEGYGLNNARVKEAAQNGVTLIITVDNGIAAVEETAYARELGVDVIITDHHQPQDVLPQAIAVVDPHRKDCEMAFRGYAGVGVAFLLACALEGDSDTVLAQFGDLVALGTLADVMPLEAENRRLVRAGLQQINQNPRAGIAALLQVAGAADKPLSSSSAVFTISPRINAAGRMADPNLAARLLLAQMSVAVSFFHEAREHHLGKPGHGGIGFGEGFVPALEQRGRKHQVAHAQRRRHRLRERAHVNDAVGVHGVQGRKRPVEVAELAAVVVLKDVGVGLSSPCDEALAHVGAHDARRGELAGRRDVDKPRIAGFNVFDELVGL